VRKRIELPDLTAYDQPPWNHAGSVSTAFDAVLNAADEQSSEKAYHDLLFAVGNNHAGTYYSVVLGVLPAVGVVLCEGAPWSKHAVLEALIDLYVSFEPENGQEIYCERSLKDTVDEAIGVLRPLVERLAGESFVGKSARELIAHLRP